jgi:hypothetical protein
MCDCVNGDWEWSMSLEVVVVIVGMVAVYLEGVMLMV